MNDTEKRLQEALDRQRSSTPGIIQNAVLMEVADILEDLLEETKKSTAHGLFEPALLSVGAAVTQLDPKSQVTMPWKSVVLANDGPQPIFVAINKDYFDPVPLNPGQDLPVDMGRDMITQVLLTTTNPEGGGGGSASVRLFAIK
jgi:hypothetical protein